MPVVRQQRWWRTVRTARWRREERGGGTRRDAHEGEDGEQLDQHERDHEGGQVGGDLELMVFLLDGFYTCENLHL